MTALVVAAVVAASKDSPPPPTSSTGSCPVVYSWNGHEWVMDSGTFGGAIVEALQRTDVSSLDHAVSADGTLRLKVANILDDTDFVDAMSVLAVDHDPGVVMAPDGRGGIHALGSLVGPLSARDFDGHDVLPRVATADGWNWESSIRNRDTSSAAEVRDGIELAFLRPHGAAHAHLMLVGNNTPWAAYFVSEIVRAHGASLPAWYDSLNANPTATRAFAMHAASEAFLGASVLTSSGWTPEGSFWEAGPEVTKRQVLDLDLSHVPGDTVHVRLSSVPSFWLIDRVAMDFTDDRRVSVSEVHAKPSDRNGDVAREIASIDGRYFAMALGATTELRFEVPPVPAGQTRTYMLRSTGWYRIQAEPTGAPDNTLLREIAEPRGISKAAVARLNDALRSVVPAASGASR